MLSEEGFCIGQVDNVEDDPMHLHALVPKNSNDQKNWVCSERSDSDWIKKEFVMDIYPSLDIAWKLSTRRKVVYELLNEEIVDTIM